MYFSTLSARHKRVYRVCINDCDDCDTCCAGRATEADDGDVVSAGSAERHVRQSGLVPVDALFPMQKKAGAEMATPATALRRRPH